ncbi:hypothetical protein GSY71_00010 [Pusillimonas sp. TS35]|uniref:TadE/TadG family type IV pilus assembly protein n=1 Tax=Paracandidimonas lactea TaxID=2895524 RepID=UPI00136F7985|nr:TadE family protein [Paracandidimonas lactea]MYN11542.1 hypothetical protein [Pusillimonas sp. TS35]
MAEFTVIAGILFSLALGAFEAARWFSTRQMLSLALLEAGRAGIVHHAHPDAIASAFEQGLRPLTARGRAPSKTSGHPRVQAWQAHPFGSPHGPPSWRTSTAHSALPVWQIEIHSPILADFRNFSDPGLRHLGVPHAAINNHYLHEQHMHRQAGQRQERWVAAANSLAAGQKHMHRNHKVGETELRQARRSIYEANTLTLRLTYALKPLVPGIAGVLRTIGKGSNTPAGRIMARGHLPIRCEISLMMQSHPVEWPMRSGGPIVRATTK